MCAVPDDEHRGGRAALRAISAGLAALLTASLLSAAPAAAQAECTAAGTAGRVWESTLDVGHPLSGTVLDARTGTTMPRAAFDRLFAASLVPATPIILLGETHDNPDHHALQAALIGLFACASTAPQAAVFEHIRADQQPALDRFTEFNAKARRLGNSGDLLRFLDWDNSGWPAARMFLPLFDAVIAARLAILPGDPPRARVRGLARNEPGAVSDADRARLRLDASLPQPLTDALMIELRGSHCGALPESAIAPMSAAQRYRDAHLADAMLAAAANSNGAVLLAGNGHVRTDRAVPWHIRQRKPDAPILAIMAVEVEDGQTDPMTYVPRAPDNTPAVDYIVFTPRAERADPCATMRSSPKAGRG